MSRLTEALPEPPFEGFSPAAFAFFRELAAHQSKAWFDAHREVYEGEVQAPFRALIAAVTGRLAKKGLVFCADPRRAMFRINRDVRFSADKSPYKTHAGAAITRDGEKQSPGVLYIHVDPEGCFVAAGFFRPAPPVLQWLRAAIADDPAAWRKVGKALAGKILALDREDALVKVPRGFEGAPPDIAADLRLKSFIVRRALPEALMSGPDLVDTIASFAQAASPLLNFGWSAL